MNKNFICIITLCISVLFCACSKQLDVNGENINNDISSSISDISSATDAGENNAAQNTDSGNNITKNTTANNDNTISTTVKAPNNQVTEQIKATAENSPPKSYVVSLKIDCSNAVNYGIRENDVYSKIIPENGIILSNDNIEFSDGETVVNVLKRILKENKIACQITSGGYVRSIGGLSEFDCGSSSGWLYKVNGVSPNVSAKSCKLNSGDRIEFIYTCKNGDV